MGSDAARVRVWDLPTRAFHWSLALLVAFSYTTGKVGGSWMEWHLRSGYGILALVLFRLAWGVVGSDTARFSQFVRGPGAALAHARDFLARRHHERPGHNPLGGWMVLLLLALILVQAASGLFADDEIATQGPLAVRASNAFIARMSTLHSVNSWIVAAAVALHVLAIAAYRWRLGLGLTAAMWRGWIPAPPGAAPPQPAFRGAGRALVLLAVAAALVYALVVVYPAR